MLSNNVEFAVRGDVEVNNLSQGAYSPCVYRHKTWWLWYFVHGDDNVGLGAVVDLEWYRQQVSKRFTTKLRGYLGLAAHDKCENANLEPCVLFEILGSRTC